MKLLKYKEFSLLKEQSTIKKITKIQFLEAARKSDFSTIQLYVEQGGNIEVNDNLGKTALIFACQYGKFDIVKYLIEKGANVNTRYKNGWATTALITACSKDGQIYLEIVKYLIDNGADIELTDNDQETALMWASRFNCLSIAKCLIENGANLEKKDKGGATALYYAVQYNCIEMIQYLIEKGADINTKVKSGLTPLMLVSMHNKLSLVEYFIEKGADLNLKDKERKTALMHAKDPKIIEILKNPNEILLRRKLGPTMSKTQKNSGIF